MSHQYTNDVERLADRCQLVMDSFVDAPDIDQEALDKAFTEMQSAFLWLGHATGA